MGVRINSGTITIHVSDMVLDDPDTEDEAVDEISTAVQGAIRNGCSAYANGLSLYEVSLDDVESTTKVAEVRLTASVNVKLTLDPDGPSAEDWADMNGWNFLAFEASDVDFDYTVEDHNTGDDPDRADWASDDSVEDPRQRSWTLQHQAEGRAREAAELQQRVLRIIAVTEGPMDTAVRAEKLTDVRAVFDVDVAHQLALDIDSHHAWNRMESNS